MKNTFLTGVIVLLAFSLLKCRKDVPFERDWPVVNTLPVTDVTQQGAKFNARITYRGNSEILNYGFVWSVLPRPTLEISDRKVFSENPVSDAFSAEITTTLSANLVFHVRSFVKTTDYIVYGTEVEFFSSGSGGPVIVSFLPRTGTWGDTITLRGKNFSYVNDNNSVWLEELKASLVFSTDTLIIFTIPEARNSDSVKINVAVTGKSTTSSDYFKYRIPEITGISPLTGTFLDTLIITGKNFGKEIRYNNVYLNDLSAEIITSSPVALKITVPANLDMKENIIKVVSTGIELLYNQRFILNPPVITSFAPDTITRQYEIITINGANFNPVLQNNKVMIEEYEAEVLESSGNHLKVKLPYGCIQYFNVSVFKNMPVLISLGEQSVQLMNGLPVSYKSNWTRKNDFPGPARIKAVVFSVSGKGYFGTGYDPGGNTHFNDFWEYDQATDSWALISDLPGPPRAAAVAFSLSGKGFVGTGTERFKVDNENDTNHLKDFYSYDPVTGNWLKLSDFQGIGRHSAACFTIQNEAFVGTGHWGNNFPSGNLMPTDDFWKYNPATDTWSEIQNFSIATETATGFSIGAKGFVYCSNRLYEFDGGTWNTIVGPAVSTVNNIAFSVNNIGYFGLGHDSHNGTNDLWEYNPSDQTFINRHMKFNGQRFGVSVFVINNKAYLVGGNSNDVNEIVNEVWEFDPLKP